MVLVYSIPLYSASLLEHITLYLAPIPLLIYMYENVKSLKIRLLKRLYWLLLAVQVVFTAGILALHTFDMMHCAATIKYLHIIIFHLIYFTVVLVMNLKSSQLTNRLYLIGVLIVFGCIGYDLVSYNYIRYYGQSFMTLRGVSSIGVMIFIFILIIAFYINLTQKMMMEKERNVLIKRANTDELTQLYNRRYCSEYMEKIDVGKDSGYALISETDGESIEKACQIADGRMYEDKKRYKHSGGNGR